MVQSRYAAHSGMSMQPNGYGNMHEFKDADKVQRTLNTVKPQQRQMHIENICARPNNHLTGASDGSLLGKWL